MIISLARQPGGLVVWQRLGRIGGVITRVSRPVSEPADRMVRLAPMGVVAWALLVALVQLAAIFLIPWPGEERTVVKLVYVVFIPALVALLVRGIRNTASRSSWALLTVVTMPVLAVLPFSGSTFALNTAFVGCLFLVFVPPPWSVMLFAAVTVFAGVAMMVWVVVPPSGLGHSYSRLEGAGYDTVAILWRGVALAMMVWLVRILRDLQDARQRLAARALVIERQRIDGEVARTIGAALELIIAGGDAAGGLVPGDPEAAARELRAVTARSRAALADARSMLTGYRTVSPEAELAAAATLLAAAGIRATVLLPYGGLPPELPSPLRAKLRAMVAEALHDTRDCVFEVTHDGPEDLDIRLLARGAA